MTWDTAENGIVLVFSKHLWLVFIWDINSAESKHQGFIPSSKRAFNSRYVPSVLIHKSPACKNQRLRRFGYLWPWGTFYQWHLPSCLGCLLSTGASPLPPLTWTSCPSINISSLLFWQMSAEAQWNVTRRGFVCVYLVPSRSGLAGCNQRGPSALFRGLQ